jgi:hypothetical protein
LGPIIYTVKESENSTQHTVAFSRFKKMVKNIKNNNNNNNTNYTNKLVAIKRHPDNSISQNKGYKVKEENK